MSGKTRALYEAVLKRIKEVFIEKYPNSRIAIRQARSDFEKGLMEALAATYENVEVIGCWFHYGQVGH